MKNSDAIIWLFLFMCTGAVWGALFTPFVIATRKGLISYMSAFGFGVALCMLGCIPVRLLQSEITYHAIFREGWWPVIWAISYTAVFITVLSWSADHIWNRIKKDGQ
jgi:hypothetical protein